MNTASDMFSYMVMIFFRYVGVSILFAFLFMYLYLHVVKLGWKKAILLWIEKIREDKDFRCIFVLVVCIFFILFNTILCRRIIEDPLSSVIGKFILIDQNYRVNTEGLANIILFIPYGCSLLLGYKKKQSGDSPMTILQLIKIVLMYSFLFTLGIEVFQLVFKVGTFQLSDIFYNTIGGLIGGGLFTLLNGFIRYIKKRKYRDVVDE